MAIHLHMMLSFSERQEEMTAERHDGHCSPQIRINK